MTQCIDQTNLEQLAEVLNVLSQSNRLKIICMLEKHGEMCVCEIMPELGLKQNLVSHHLHTLKKINLIKSEKRGVRIGYSLNREYYDTIKNAMKEVFNL